MAVGTVKWFSDKMGYGFIAEENGREVFVHHSKILGEGYRTLQEGQRVRFEEIQSDRGKEAAHVIAI